ncbi:MAG: hypothetical protein HQL74_07405 [Magnetococcales bacterium]|nr:hypothetical protein [Magnetococcales bacterium]
MENIDDFYRGVWLILGRLYQSFPVPILLKMEDLEEFEDVSGDLTRKARLLRVYSATMRFLQKEGFLSFESSFRYGNLEDFYKVVLTRKGLAALSIEEGGGPPNEVSATHGETMAELGSDTWEGGEWDGGKAIILTVLGG